MRQWFAGVATGFGAGLVRFVDFHGQTVEVLGVELSHVFLCAVAGLGALAGGRATPWSVKGALHEPTHLPGIELRQEGPHGLQGRVGEFDGAGAVHQLGITMLGDEAREGRNPVEVDPRRDMVDRVQCAVADEVRVQNAAAPCRDDPSPRAIDDWRMAGQAQRVLAFRKAVTRVMIVAEHERDVIDIPQMVQVLHVVQGLVAAGQLEQANHGRSVVEHAPGDPCLAIGQRDLVSSRRLLRSAASIQRASNRATSSGAISGPGEMVTIGGGRTTGTGQTTS